MKSMKSALKLCLFFLSAIGVFANPSDVEEFSVMVGNSVTLRTDFNGVQESDSIEWRFNGTRIAKISNSESSLGDTFVGRLQLDNWTGDLKISNIGTTDSGQYTLKTKSARGSQSKTFNVTGVSLVSAKSVLVGESITLDTGVTDIQRYDLIRWRFGDSPISEMQKNTGKLFDVLDKSFKDRLQMDYWTGSLTITNTATTHTGIYEVDMIKNNKYTIHKTFSVTIIGKMDLLPVNEGRTLTLKSPLTKTQSGDQVTWMFGEAHIVSLWNYNGDTQVFAYKFVDGRFKETVKLNEQTGSLTIKNATTKHAGVYKLKISSRSIHPVHKFLVTVNASDVSSVVSPGTVAGIAVSVILFLILVVAIGLVFYFRQIIFKLRDELRGFHNAGETSVSTYTLSQSTASGPRLLA